MHCSYCLKENEESIKKNGIVDEDCNGYTVFINSEYYDFLLSKLQEKLENIQ